MFLGHENKEKSSYDTPRPGCRLHRRTRESKAAKHQHNIPAPEELYCLALSSCNDPCYYHKRALQMCVGRTWPELGYMSRNWVTS